MWEYRPTEELYHYGVKGMKWGVRRKRVAKKSRNDKIVMDALKSGRVSKQINRDKQRRHIKREYIKGRSYIDGDLDTAQRLVDELYGTGRALKGRNGNWLHKEAVETAYIIGTHVDENGVVTRTNKAMIVYSRTGSHIYPRGSDDNES